MELIESNDSVLLKILYYCNQKREVFFTRSEVSDYLIKSNIYDIPDKPGFDGNITYFGYDIKDAKDKNERILLLRGNLINKKCIEGSIIFKINKDNTNIFCNSDFESLEVEYNLLKHNKSIESKAFEIRKKIINYENLIECEERLTRNHKIYKKGCDFFIFPKIVLNPINKEYYYEIINYDNFLDILPLYFIFPKFKILDKENWLEYINDYKIENYEYFIGNNYIGNNNTKYCYFFLNNNKIIPKYVEYDTAEQILSKYNIDEYSLESKETTRQALINTRINQDILRKLCLKRDHTRCILCDIDNESLLICSHIKPWKDDENGRLDINNAITLCSFHDSLFDNGYISFDKTGKLIISKTIKNKKQGIIYLILKNSSHKISNIITKRMKHYLRFHEENIFLK